MSATDEAVSSPDPAAAVAVSFERDGNFRQFATQGWGAAEGRFCWLVGGRGVLTLPPLARSPSFALVLECDPLRLAGVTQTLALEFNGVALGVVQPTPGMPLLVGVPGEIVSDSRPNEVVFLAPNALVPAEHAPENRDRRALSFAWRRLELAPDFSPPFEAPQWLPQAEADDAPPPVIASLYQSLGQNCELGVFQRRSGAEPVGLLRFASLFPQQLVRGLRTRFEGIAAVENLSFFATPAGEMMGLHAIYGLTYHTFKSAEEIEAGDFKAKEARRLGYLARLLIEQMENDEKIFVRWGGFEAEGEYRALHRLLGAFNPQARLLLVRTAPPASPEHVGGVQRLAPNLYRGFVSTFADPGNVAGSVAIEDWSKICATLYYDQRAQGRAGA